MSQNNPTAANIKPEKAKTRKKVPKRITERYLHNAGLAYLQRFPASSAHFRTVMMRKIDRSCRHHTDQETEKCTALLDTLVAKFQELGLLDDAAYIRGMVTSLRRRGLSARMIESKLAQKGVTTDAARKAVSEYDMETAGEDGEITAATLFARKKRIGPFATSERNADPERGLAVLARGGYSYDICKKVLETSIEDAEERLNCLR